MTPLPHAPKPAVGSPSEGACQRSPAAREHYLANDDRRGDWAEESAVLGVGPIVPQDEVSTGRNLLRCDPSRHRARDEPRLIESSAIDDDLTPSGRDRIARQANDSLDQIGHLRTRFLAWWRCEDDDVPSFRH